MDPSVRQAGGRIHPPNYLTHKLTIVDIKAEVGVDNELDRGSGGRGGEEEDVR